jgi:hypothetical protein
MQAALPRCNVLHSNAENCDDRGPAVTDAIRCPRSQKKADASSSRAPRVSTAIDVNLYDEASERYFIVVRCSGSFATALGLSTARFKSNQINVIQSTLDKSRLKHKMEIALTNVDSKKFQQDTQRLKKSFSHILVEHKGRRSLSCTTFSR